MIAADIFTPFRQLRRRHGRFRLSPFRLLRHDDAADFVSSPLFSRMMFRQRAISSLLRRRPAAYHVAIRCLRVRAQRCAQRAKICDTRCAARACNAIRRVMSRKWRYDGFSLLSPFRTLMSSAAADAAGAAFAAAADANRHAFRDPITTPPPHHAACLLILRFLRR